VRSSFPTKEGKEANSQKEVLSPHESRVRVFTVVAKLKGKAPYESRVNPFLNLPSIILTLPGKGWFVD